MEKNRIEAFSDGVIAIIITIMVLELKVPHGDTWEVLAERWPIFLSYVLSFLYVGTYWNNHHHMMQAARTVTGAILWTNLHLLFWLSLIPFTTGWMGENHFTQIPTMLYGINLLLCAIAYYIMQLSLANIHGPNNPIAQALGRDVKGKASLALYVLGIAVAAFMDARLAFMIFVGISLIWVIPDKRMEAALMQQKSKEVLHSPKD
ncbi:MAG: TMEM175 family protein [Caldilineaceae bacterium]